MWVQKCLENNALFNNSYLVLKLVWLKEEAARTAFCMDL